MKEASPALNSRLNVVRSRKRIVYRRTRSFYQVLSVDTADYKLIRQRIHKIAQEFSIQELAVDRLFQGVQVCSELSVTAWM